MKDVGARKIISLNYCKPVIGLRLEFSIEGVILAKTPQEAVNLAFQRTEQL